MENNKISNTRRKILLASVATPLVATLQSGAAMAASSAAVCRPIDYEVSNKKFPDNGSSMTGDTAVRYSVPTYKKRAGVVGSKYIYDLDGVLYYQSGQPFLGTSAELMHKYSKLPMHKQASVLMLYGNNSNGTYEVGLWPKYQVSMNQYPINASCLTSIADVSSNMFRGL